MVDPNRKINRLTDKDIEFLDECEELFGQRYSEEDEEFQEHCKKGQPPPPILDNWKSSGQRDHYAGGGAGGPRKEHRGWQQWRGGGGGGYRGRYCNRSMHSSTGRRYSPYTDSHDKSSSGGSSTRNQQDQQYGEDRGRGAEHPPPRQYRRDYGNFVAASREDH